MGGGGGERDSDIFQSVSSFLSGILDVKCSYFFIFSLFLGMVVYANEFKTEEKQKLTEVKKNNCNIDIQ